MFDGLLEPWHLVIILVIVLIIFGPGKLPDLGSALGRGIKEFRGGIREIQDDLDINADSGTQSEPTAAATAAPAAVTAPATTPLAAATMPISSPNSATMTPVVSPNSAPSNHQAVAPSATQVMAPPQVATQDHGHGQACSICGTVAPSGARFCANCGNPIS